MHAARLILLTAIALLLIITGCSHTPEEIELNRAEAVIEQHPDSALAILQAIDGSALKGELRARHALLLSQALDKNYIDIADDSIINIALSYYRHDNTRSNECMMSFYYKANTYFNAGDYSTAIYNLAIADTLAARLGSYSWRGLANSLMAFSLNKLFDHKRNLEYAKRALYYFRLADDSTHIANQIYNVGLAYIETEQYDSALVMFNKLPIDETYYGSAICLLETGRIDEYRTLISQYPHLEKLPGLLCRYANKMSREGNISESEKAINQASLIDSISAHSAKILYSRAALSYVRGDWENYSKYVTQLLNNSYRHTEHFRSFYIPEANARADEFISELERDNSRQKHHQLILWITAVSVSLIILGLILVITVILHHKKKESMMRRLAELLYINDQSKDTYEAEIKKLTIEKEQLKQKSIALEDKIVGLESEQLMNVLQAGEDYIRDELDALYKLYQEYIHTPASKVSKKQIADKVRSFSKPKFNNTLENIIDIRNSRIVTRMKEAGFRSNDILLLCYLQSGFSTELISLILNVDANVIYTRKSRLKSRLTTTGLDNICSL